MDALLVRNSLKMFTAVFITAAIALWFERIEFVWYPLMAVVIGVDDNDEHTVKAATARVMGTVVGGHTSSQRLARRSSVCELHT